MRKIVSLRRKKVLEFIPDELFFVEKFSVQYWLYMNPLKPKLCESQFQKFPALYSKMGHNEPVFFLFTVVSLKMYQTRWNFY